MSSLSAAEYSALKNEIAVRIKIRDDFVKQVLAGKFALLTLISFDSSSFSILLFAYPILVFFVAIGWVRNLLANLSIALYIRENSEKRLRFRGWETLLKENPSRYNTPFILLGTFSSGGIFIAIQLLCIGIGHARVAGAVSLDNLSGLEISLIYLSLLSVIFTFSLIVYAWCEAQRKSE